MTRLTAPIALLATVACAPARNEVIIEIVADTSLGGVSVVAEKDGQAQDILSRTLSPNGLSLPATYAVYTDDGSTPDVLVKVSGLNGIGAPLVTRSALFTLPRGRTAFLRLGLVSRCKEPAGISCGSGQSCAEGHCVDERIDPALLPDFRAELEGALACADSGFIDSRLGTLLPVLGDGRCPAGQHCREGLCYPGRPQALVMFTGAAMSRAVAAAGIVAGDFDEDGRLDVVALDTAGDRVALLAGGGDGSFSVRTAASGAVVAGVPIHVIARDYDGDGHLDLALSYAADQVRTLRGVGDGTFVAGVTVAASEATGPLASGDFDGDGHPDIAVSAGERAALFLGAGDGTFRAGDSWTAGRSVTALAAAHLDPGKAAWLVAALADGVEIFQAGWPAARLELPVVLPKDVAAADFAGDGFQDLAFATSDSLLWVVPGRGDAALGEPQRYPRYASGERVASDRVATGDFDGDGRPDVAAFVRFTHRDTVDTAVQVSLADPSGALDLPVTVRTTSTSYDWALGDFDGDGKLDIVTLATPPPEIAPGGLLFFRNTTLR